MDLSSLMGTFLSNDTVSGLAQKTGASQKDVTDVLTSAIPELFNGAKTKTQIRKELTWNILPQSASM